MNVVPLIDILLVLLVIFMIIPNSRGMQVQLPESSDPQPGPSPEVVVVQVLANGTLKLNQQTVSGTRLRERWREILKFRAERVAFVRCENPVEFKAVVEVIDDMRAAGISSVGLLTPELDQNH